MNKNEILNLIKELLEKTTVSVIEISLGEDEKPSKDGGEVVWIRAEVKEPHLFLDRGGEGLSALNHLVRKMVETKIFGGKTEREESPLLDIMVDINEFQKKKIESIKAIAHMMAERARYFKSNIEVDPMSAFERRVIHEFLSDATDLKTESAGIGPHRHVVIKYIGEL